MLRIVSSAHDSQPGQPTRSRVIVDGYRTYHVLDAHQAVERYPHQPPTDEQLEWASRTGHLGNTQPKMRQVNPLRVVRDFDE